MKNAPSSRFTVLNVARALALCAGLISSAGHASDQATVLANVIAQKLQPAQLSSLLSIAGGHAEYSRDDIASLEQLQLALDVNHDVAMALLRNLDALNLPKDQLIEDLAQSATSYHAVTADLAGMQFGDPDVQRTIVDARTAMASGQFQDAVAQIRQLEDREIASVEQPSGASAGRAGIIAARARTLLGKIALMNLQYEEATRDFETARQRIATIPSGQPSITSTTPTGLPVKQRTEQATPPLPNLDSDWSLQIPLVQEAVAVPSLPADQHEKVAPEKQPIMTVMVRPTMTGAASQETPRQEASLPAMKSLPVLVLRPVTAGIMKILLQRGDAMLALGDLAAARLLYQRAAAAGDPRGATGVGKTYDPQILSLIGARGIKPDPEVAEAWYRRALQLGDASAAARLKVLGVADNH